MKRILARAPVRADLAGGTLDLWPMYLFHPGARTVNVAISYFAEAEVAELSNSSIEVVFTDSQTRRSFESVRELAADPEMALVARAMEHFHLSGLRITTRTDAPRGSGLGGSSALAIALVRALSSFAGSPIEGERLIELVRDLETRLLGIPAGVQDYYPAVFGGLGALHLEPGGITRQPLSLAPAELGKHMVLHYSGVSHFSGTNNWEIYRRQIDGDKTTREGLSRIAAAAADMERALQARDLKAAGEALGAEWRARKELIQGISTPEIEKAIELAMRAGAWAGKVCGAGGGGCILFLTPEERRDAVREALLKAPGRLLDVTPVPNGLTVEEPGDQPAVSAIPGRRGARGSSAIEHRYVNAGGARPYRPWLAVDMAVTFDAPRDGIHHTLTRSLLAPIDVQNQETNWASSMPADLSNLPLSQDPEPGRNQAPGFSMEQVETVALDSLDALRQLIASTERLRLFHNRSFELTSEPAESREQFMKRCLEAADRSLEAETERLERTFRRRIDQMRERADRDRRDQATEAGAAGERREMGIAWDQALYNITSGKPQTGGAPASPDEADYLEKIGQLQKQWNRELETLKDELYAKAREIEEWMLAPTARSVEPRRFQVLWAAEADLSAAVSR